MHSAEYFINHFCIVDNTLTAHSTVHMQNKSNPGPLASQQSASQNKTVSLLKE